MSKQPWHRRRRAAPAAGISGMRLRKEAPGEAHHPEAHCVRRQGAGGKSPGPERQTPHLREAVRMTVRGMQDRKQSGIGKGLTACLCFLLAILLVAGRVKCYELTLSTKKNGRRSRSSGRKNHSWKSSRNDFTPPAYLAETAEKLGDGSPTAGGLCHPPHPRRPDPMNIRDVPRHIVVREIPGKES